eukprot:COSAG06_NODE_3361_length_5453_cov_8.336758_5_plen_43_part_00
MHELQKRTKAEEKESGLGRLVFVPGGGGGGGGGSLFSVLTSA